MEIGPIRNQILISWPLANDLPKLARDNKKLGWRQDKRNWSNQESKFDFLATRQQLVKN